MDEKYYTPCDELGECNRLIEEYFKTGQYEKCFLGHLALAEKGYPLAECQVGYFYLNGIGTVKDTEKAIMWTRAAADHGDRDGQFNLASFYDDGVLVPCDFQQAVFWYKKAARQGQKEAVERLDRLGVSYDDTSESPRSALQCRIYPLHSLKRYKYVVICTFFGGKPVLSRHKMRDTWETQGGHIEKGETPLSAARRELFEESGITAANLFPVCDYWGFNENSCSNGVVFAVVAAKLGALPESEMREVRVFDTLPHMLTYPSVTPVLFDAAQKKLDADL